MKSILDILLYFIDFFHKKKIISFFKKNKYQLKYISQVNYIFKKNKQ